jgi:hypothetical protein
MSYSALPFLRRPVVGLFTVALALSLAACGGGGGPAVPLEGAFVSGHVEALGSGSVLSGATIRLGDRTTTTNERGWYLFDEVDAAERAVITASLDGYIGAAEAVRVVDGAAYHVDLIMVPAPAAQTVSASEGGTIGGAGAEITIPANAFVDGSGDAVSGDVSVTVAAVDPGADEQAQDAFPGEFVGVQLDGTESPLESFGIFAIEARQGDALLDLAPGVALGVRVPIAASGLATAPASIALWSFDEASGLWEEEGTATRDGDTYRASVPHLSWWNFDVAYISQTTCVEVCYEDDTGARVRGVLVRIRMPSIRATVSGYTGEDGCVAINLRASTDAVLEASYNDNTPTPRSFTTQATITNTGRVPPMCQDLGVFNISPAAAQAVLVWGPEPSDLDSHMTGPSAAGRFHTYYGARGSETAEPYCALDTDDTSAYGPEVITLHRPMSGVFRYSVHNYSGQASHPIEASGASVVLIVPGLGQILEFTPPASNGSNGNVWRVFELQAEGSRIVGVRSINDFTQTGSSDGPAFHP